MVWLCGALAQIISVKDLELIHLRAARLIHKLPRDMEDETVFINAN